MRGTNPPATDPPLTEVKVQVPVDRVAGFYAFVGDWLRAPDAVAVPRRRASGRARRRTGAASKYEPLGAHLARLEEDRVTLAFDAIEDVLGTGLPSSARRHRAWWANTDTHSQGAVWLEQGWLVSGTDLEEGRVTFVRDRRG